MTCSILQNSPLFSQSVLEGAKYRRRLCKINRVFFASLPSLIRFLASLQTFPLTVRAHGQIPSTGIRRKPAKVGAVHKSVKMWSRQNLIPVSRYFSLTIPASQPNKNRKSRSRSLSKFPLPAPFFSSHLEYHHKKQPNPASRQSYCRPSLLGVDL